MNKPWTVKLILSTNMHFLSRWGAVLFYVMGDSGMERYFFHIACPRGMLMDENGRDFSELKGAKGYAARIAAELAQGGSYVGCSVCIANKSGKELDRVSIGSGWVKVVGRPYCH